MPNLTKIGRNVFALGFIGLAILGFIYQDFIIGRPPAWPPSLNFNPGLGYVANALIILAGIAVLMEKNARQAGFLIAILVFLLSAGRHFPNFTQDWLNTYKTLAFIGGSLIVAVSFEKDIPSKVPFILVGSVFLSVFLVASGYAHFKFVDFVSQFIPAYIPFHGFFAYFTAVCLIAGGIGILLPKVSELAAFLSGVMLTGWFLLLHIPRFLMDTENISDRMGLFESFTFAGIFFVLAGQLSKEKIRA